MKDNIQQVMSPKKAEAPHNEQQQNTDQGDSLEQFDVQDLMEELRHLREEVNVLRSSQREKAENETRPPKRYVSMDEEIFPPFRRPSTPGSAMHLSELGGNSPRPRAQGADFRTAEQRSVFSDRRRQVPGENRRLPQMRDMKLSIIPFDGTEVYPGLGSGFQDWGVRFVREINIVEETTGIPWPEDLKVDRLNRYLVGKAERFFSECIGGWWAENPSLWYALDKMNMHFRTELSQTQGLQLLTCRKDHQKSWNDHYLYLLAVQKALGGGAEKMILENIVIHASADLNQH